VPVRDLEALRWAQLDIPAYDKFRAAADFFSPHLFCLKGATPAGQTFARHFGTPPDLMEDPFTGSATGGMAAYLWHYGLIEQPTFVAEQGHWLNRPGQATVEVIGARSDIETVKVGGPAVTIVRGELSL
jgi:trans-2,3-dihydro-3-hydroxyanthranilate isomerase